MEPKIILYDSNDVKIGETFVRRARQLVKQQKAVWTDSTETALRFMPGMENTDITQDDETASEPVAQETVSSDSAPQDEAWLVALAEKRLRARSMFIIHSVALFPVWLVIFIFCIGIFRGFEAGFFLGALGGSWGTAYIIHAYLFLKNHRKLRRSSQDRKARQLAVEIATIKAELNM